MYQRALLTGFTLRAHETRLHCASTVEMRFDRVCYKDVWTCRCVDVRTCGRADARRPLNLDAVLMPARPDRGCLWLHARYESTMACKRLSASRASRLKRRIMPLK